MSHTGGMFPFDFVTMLYGFLAVFGGVARYLRSFVDGAPFNLSILVASAVVSGFGGLMFALVGVSMNMPQPILYAMAGVGGFFSEQTMKFLLEWLQRRVNT